MVASLLCPLTEEEREVVHNAMYGNGPSTEILAKVGPNSVQRQSMHRLQPGEWLNDEVINAFHVLLDQRDGELCKLDPDRKRNHWFKTLFMTKLLNEGSSNDKYEYKNVKRWSKNVPGNDIFKLGKIFVPINVGKSHWVCALIDMIKKKIYMYDSKGSSGMDYLRHLFRYLQDEYEAKNDGATLPDINEWEIVGRPSVEIPEQLNGEPLSCFVHHRLSVFCI